MKMPEPYRLADKAIAQLNKAALRRTEQAKQRIRTLGFDELNVLQETDSLYSDLDRMNRKKYEELFRERYIELMIWLLARELTEEEEDSIDELVEMHITGLLDEPNETTHYIYSTEVLRKRDRAKEAILSVPTKAQKQLEIDKQLRHFLQMTGWYADFVSQDAEITAFESAGVKRAQRHEMDDSKTCQVCRNADGEIYETSKIPPLPHLRCRRWFTPI